ncbi:MAG: hypothetical protein ACI8R6_000341, partial [Candidatus Paceibacteria bacterium]
MIVSLTESKRAGKFARSLRFIFSLEHLHKTQIHSY